MENQNELMVDGFLFGSRQDAELARQELEKITFLEKRLDYQNPQSVLMLYNKAIDNRIFKTPVGYHYLQGLQAYLQDKGLEEQAKSIPLYNIFGGSLKDELPRRQAKSRVQPSQYKELRSNLRKSVVLNLILAVAILIMFVISLTGSSPTIVNYEKKLTDKYAAWEQELSERETAVREKEREFQMEEESEDGYGAD